MGKKEKETVCLDDKQMHNIIEAARADETEDRTRIKKACPKALKFVRGYHPKKEKGEEHAAVKFAEKIVNRVIRKLEGFF